MIHRRPVRRFCCAIRYIGWDTGPNTARLSLTNVMDLSGLHLGLGWTRIGSARVQIQTKLILINLSGASRCVQLCWRGLPEQLVYIWMLYITVACLMASMVARLFRIGHVGLLLILLLNRSMYYGTGFFSSDSVKLGAQERYNFIFVFLISTLIYEHRTYICVLRPCFGSLLVPQISMRVLVLFTVRLLWLGSLRY
jgi:hypothetical protein